MTHTPKPWSDQETAEALRQARDFMSLPLNAVHGQGYVFIDVQ